MRLSIATLSFAFLGHASAFSPALPVRSASTSFRMADAVLEADAVETESAEEAATPAPVAPPAPSKPSMTMKELRKSVDSLTKENFSETLSKLEPFLTKEAGSTIYAKSMRRISRNAKMLGVEVPAGYAVEAACTAKRRAKQDAFIQMKIEEAAAAEPAEEEGEAAAEDAPAEE